eukprot:CAMPEP_0185034850 /NCGR_PEP_ID=MMETSP1103-20130426/25108_1 /TAXON_ID=36769 /ORGANISM="Paraphysomonas bandaiensis, Strain Caron Lab Isolate" /LENGTH=92 /DNA_ID=CAMNT_0027571663 /DNA_START=61 /DNA_END=335 /DNA_ORIENTATION=+
MLSLLVLVYYQCLPQRAARTKLGSNIENEYSAFQFSVPFTKGGKAHAKPMDLQWKKTAVLYVPQPFPYVLTCQAVCKREVRDLSPIEVAIDG